MSSVVPRSTSSVATQFVSGRAARALARVEERALLRAAEVKGIGFVGQVAQKEVAGISICEEELAKLTPPSARLRLAAIGDGVTAAIQARVLELMDGV